MRTRTSIVAALVPIALLGAAACGDDDSGGGAAENETSSTEAHMEEHNEADVEFAQMMIPHHRDAVAMAALAPNRAEDPFILDIASRIQGAQDPEIQQMTGWLEEWGEEVPAEEAGHDMGESTTGGSDTSAAPETGGETAMMDTAGLEAAAGAAFDRMFAEMMIGHHQGAVDMANEEIANGQFPDAIALAEAIIEAQEAEIAELESFLQRAP